MISSLKEIQQEIRCWVVGGKVITISQYKLGRRVTYKNLDFDEEAFEFAQSMVDIYRPAEAFCIDICRTADGMRIVEINCINCSGFYDMNTQKLLYALEQHFNKN
jgi:glutathione synthase/RimK-type ligase-like ATP-grasp enzyme